MKLNVHLPFMSVMTNGKKELKLLLPTARKVSEGVLLMENIRLSKFIDDPHQKFYYIYNFDHPYEFHVELIKILKEEEGKTYPVVFKTVGAAPKSLGAANFPVADPLDDDEEEEVLVDETQYGVDDDEEFDLFDGDDEEEEDKSEKESGGSFDEY